MMVIQIYSGHNGSRP